jgi:DMSO reductase family type II enzyme chaperone
MSMARELSETLARSACYKLLSLAFLPPLAKTAEVFLRLDRIAHALPPGHRALVAPIVQENVFARSGPTEREHGRLFGVGLAATPYESEYDPLASARKGHRLADLLGFYEAFGVQLADSLKEFPDHIAVELEFMAILLMKTAHAAAEEMDEARAVSEDAAQKFLTDHLAAWGGAFADRVEAATGDDFYRFSARLLREFLEAECRFLGVDPSTPAASPQEPGPLACPFARECPEVSGQA